MTPERKQERRESLRKRRERVVQDAADRKALRDADQLQRKKVHVAECVCPVCLEAKDLAPAPPDIDAAHTEPYLKKKGEWECHSGQPGSAGNCRTDEVRILLFVCDARRSGDCFLLCE